MARTARGTSQGHTRDQRERGGEGFEGGEVAGGADVLEDAGDVAGADDGEDAGAGGAADFFGEVLVALVHEAGFDAGEGAAEFGHGGFELVGLLEVFDVFGGDFVAGGEEGGEEESEEFGFLPEAEGGPDALEGEVDAAVDEFEAGAGGVGDAGGFHHFGAGLGFEAFADAAVEGLHGELGEEEGGFFLADDFEQVGVAPGVGV